jgi:hypothetical protein
LSKKYFPEKLVSPHNEQPNTLTEAGFNEEYKSKIYVKNIRKIQVGSEKIIPDSQHCYHVLNPRRPKGRTPTKVKLCTILYIGGDVLFTQVGVIHG